MRIFTVGLLAGVGWVVAGCGVPASSGEAGGGSGSGGGGSTGGFGGSETAVVTGGASSGTGAVGSTGSTGQVGMGGTSEGAGESSSTGCSFICGTTGFEDPYQCDNFAQDCPEGQKCAAWVDDGGSWNAVKCVPVMGDKQAGEPCAVFEGGGSGLDDCAEGVMCWDVGENMMGFCVELCGGSAEAPMCPEDGPCSISGEGFLNICFPGCDPLLQDCPGTLLCTPIADDFICVQDASGEEGQVNDVCEYLNACDEGLTCIDVGEASRACDPAAAGCCQPFCEFPGGGCPNADQECVQWYEPMDLPPDSPKLKYGICRIPA